MERENNCLIEYDEKRPLYERLEGIVYEKLDKAVKEAGIGVMQIAHRLKERESVAEKNRRKAGKYISITDMTDIVGIRIICYFSDQVDEAAKIVEEIFDIDWDNSIDKRAALAPTVFGYLSLHYTCRVHPEDTVGSELCTLPFEIQIRSVLQHTWAEIEHDLGYKSAFGVPYHIRREFSRIAGLLEIADESFINIRKDIVLYVEDVRERVQCDRADELLIDGNTLREFTRHSATWLELTDKVISLSGAERIEASPEEFLPQLKQLGFQTLGDLKEAVTGGEDHILMLIKDALEYFEMDEVSSNILLNYLCQSVLVWGSYTDAQLESFFSLTEKNENRIKSRAERIKKLKRRYGQET